MLGTSSACLRGSFPSLRAPRCKDPGPKAFFGMPWISFWARRCAEFDVLAAKVPPTCLEGSGKLFFAKLPRYRRTYNTLFRLLHYSSCLKCAYRQRQVSNRNNPNQATSRFCVFLWRFLGQSLIFERWQEPTRLQPSGPCCLSHIYLSMRRSILNYCLRALSRCFTLDRPSRA